MYFLVMSAAVVAGAACAPALQESRLDHFHQTSVDGRAALPGQIHDLTNGQLAMLCEKGFK